MKAIVYGSDGVMGNMLVDQIKKSNNIQLVAEITPLNNEGIKYLSQFEGEADIVIDFSHPNNLPDIIQWGLKTKKPLLLCTTGYSESDLDLIKKASHKCPVLVAGNTSMGVNIVKIILEKMVSLLGDWDIELLEKHHNRKKDSPSGTARELLHILETNNVNLTQPIYGRGLGEFKRTKGDIGVHSIRAGTIAGEHSVLFAGDEEIIEIKHQALSRKIFVNGAIKAAEWLVQQQAGFYSMRDMFKR
jgi:4-hydroxy-tetrahydrodipicolinate reductase